MQYRIIFIISSNRDLQGILQHTFGFAKASILFHSFAQGCLVTSGGYFNLKIAHAK